jgi:hypothetical protein
MAAKQIEWDTSKFLKDPSVGTKFWLEAAYRYLDEILSSHPEHRRNRAIATSARVKLHIMLPPTTA